jgi:hypothetical protein
MLQEGKGPSSGKTMKNLRGYKDRAQRIIKPWPQEKEGKTNSVFSLPRLEAWAQTGEEEGALVGQIHIVGMAYAAVGSVT